MRITGEGRLSAYPPTHFGTQLKLLAATGYNPGMSDARPKSKVRKWALPIFPLAVLAAMYVAGYFMLPEYHVRVDNFTSEVEHVRTFPLKALWRVYYPLGWLEYKIRGETVVLWSEDELENYFLIR